MRFAPRAVVPIASAVVLLAAAAFLLPGRPGPASLPAPEVVIGEASTDGAPPIGEPTGPSSDAPPPEVVLPPRPVMGDGPEGPDG